MAVVPDPGMAAILGAEVGLAVVVDLGGEAQEPAVAGVAVGQGGRRRQTVLLHGALQQDHGPVLQVGGLLHHLSVEDQVGGGWWGAHTGSAHAHSLLPQGLHGRFLASVTPVLPSSIHLWDL